MYSIDVLADDHDEGIPSKAIWDPSLSISSSASTSSESSTNNDTTTRLEDVVVDPASFVTSSEAAQQPYAAPTETNLRMSIYQEEQDEHDDNRMSSMFTNSINSAHGPNISRKDTREEEKNDKIFGSQQQDERHRFIHSLSHLSDKQLRTQLWDGFRLARVILGKPIKDKRKLSHKSILHAIRKVAEMKIQIIRMSEELDGYRQKEKKQLRHMQKQKWKLRPPTPGKENQQEQVEKVEDSLSLSSSSLFTFASSNDGIGPASMASVRDVISDSDSPKHAIKKLREQAIKILQDESDLALTQIQELEDQRKRKRRRHDDDNQEQQLLLVSPTAAAASASGVPSLFLSPCDSVDDDDFSFGTHESASDILYAFRGKRSPLQQQKLSKIMGSMGADRVNDDGNVDDNGNADVDNNLEDGVEEIRRVLQRVVAFENEQPEITMNSSPVTEVHEEVISLLTRLAQTPLPTKMPSNEPETEVEVKVEGVAQQQSSPVVVEKTNSSEEEGSDEEPPSSTEMPWKEAETEAQQPQSSLIVVDDEEMNDEGCADEEEDKVIAECQARLSFAKERETNSIQNFDHLKLQKELLDGDIAIAKKNTTQNRTKLQLQRLEGYKKQLTRLLEQEEDRAKQIKTLDSELNHLATVCVTLEDTEAQFREKHERHQTALGEFRSLTNNHTEKFRSLLGSIERGISEQSTIVLGEEKKKKNDNGDDELKSLPSQDSGSYEESKDDADASASAKKIQRLEYLLIKQNVELFTVKAKLKATELKPKKKSFRIKRGR